MGIQTWIKKIVRKIRFKKAVEKGKELESKGLTQVPTTSGFVTTPKGSPLDVSYQQSISPSGRGVVQLETTTTRRRSGGGGITSSGLSIEDLSPTALTPQEIIEVSKDGGLTPIQKFEASKDDLLPLSTPVASAVGGGYITAGGEVVRGSPYLEGRKGIRLSRETEKKIEDYQNKQKEFYQKKIGGEINKIVNWDNLTNYQRGRIYNRIYNKYNQQYQKAVEKYSIDLTEKELKKQYPDYRIGGMSTPTGISYSLIPKEITEEISTTPPISTQPPDVTPTQFGVGDITGLGIKAFKAPTQLGLEDFPGLVIKAYEKYQEVEGKVSGKIKKWWTRNLKDIEEAIKENPDGFTEEYKQNAKQARKKLETGEGLTKLEYQLVNRPLLTTAELGVAGLLSPTIFLGGVGTAQQPELPEKISKVGKKIEETGEFLQQVPDFDKIGFVTEIVGKGVRGVSTLVPETAEEILTFALFQKALMSKVIPRIGKSVGLKGLGGYEIYGGITEKGLTEEERYGKFLIGGLAVLGAIPEDIVLARKVRFRLGGTEKTKVGELGIQKTDIDLGKFDIDLKKGVGEITFDPLTLEYIPSQKEVFTRRIDPLKELSTKVNFKDKFELPKTTKTQSKILNIVKERGDIISGSFAQKTLIKGSRDFKDLDILSDNPKALAELIKKRLGDNVRIKTKKIKDSPLGEFKIYKVYDKKGKHIADLDPLRFAEEGYASLFNPIKVQGHKLLPPEIRLLSKTLQQARPLPKGKRAKVITDISQLKGEPELITDPALLRGYGIPKAKQKAMFDAQELYLTHGGKGIIPTFKDVITLKEGEFFFTPTLVKIGKAGARKSRMGFGKEIEYASFLDLMNPKERANIEFYPKAKAVVIEKAKLKKGKIEVPDIPSTEIEVVRKVPKEGVELAIQKRFKTILEGEPVEIAYVKEVPKKIKPPRRVDLKKVKKDDVKKSKTKKDESDLKDFLKEQEKKVRPRKEKKILRAPQRPTFRRPPKRGIPRAIDMDLPRELLRDVPRDLPRPLTRDIPRVPPREPTRTPPRIPPRVPPREPTRTPPRIPPRVPPKEPPKKPPIIRIGRRTVPKRPSTKEGYDVFIKSQGKWKKITKSPVDLISARDLRAFVLDSSTARSGRISKSKPIPLPYDIPRGYAEQTKRKFRAFKQKKGRKIPLKKIIIERAKYGIDTMGEKQGLSYAKLLAQRERKQMSNDFNIPKTKRQSDIFKAMAQAEKRKRKKLKSSKPIGLSVA